MAELQPELQPIIMFVFHSRHFLTPSWNLQSYLCQTLTDYVCCYSAQFSQMTSLSQAVFSEDHKRGIHTYTTIE